MLERFGSSIEARTLFGQTFYRLYCFIDCMSAQILTYILYLAVANSVYSSFGTSSLCTYAYDTLEDVYSPLENSPFVLTSSAGQVFLYSVRRYESKFWLSVARLAAVEVSVVALSPIVLAHLSHYGSGLHFFLDYSVRLSCVMTINHYDICRFTFSFLDVLGHCFVLCGLHASCDFFPDHFKLLPLFSKINGHRYDG